jgi:uncharacterized protein
MAALREIRVYPVKAFDPAVVPEARVLASGALEWDRRFALVDSGGRFVNGKNYAAVHRLRVAFDLARGEMSLEGRAFSLVSEGAAIAGLVTEFLGERVEWREDTAMGFPDDTDSPGPTLVSTASFAAVADWFAFDPEQVRRRFRANLEIEGLDAFGEDRWYGGAIRIGGVRMNVVYPCQRCIVPSRDALTGEPDPSGFQKRFAELRQQHLPERADAALFNHYYRFSANTRIEAGEAGKIIRVGDPVVETL